MSNYESVRVRLPNGQERIAELQSGTINGYRSARVNVDGERMRGRVTARHGFKDGRPLPFEVKAEDAYMLGGSVFLKNV